jgi:hypothetical protein
MDKTSDAKFRLSEPACFSLSARANARCDSNLIIFAFKEQERFQLVPLKRPSPGTCRNLPGELREKSERKTRIVMSLRAEDKSSSRPPLRREYDMAAERRSEGRYPTQTVNEALIDCLLHDHAHSRDLKASRVTCAGSGTGCAPQRVMLLIPCHFLFL